MHTAQGLAVTIGMMRLLQHMCHQRGPLRAGPRDQHPRSGANIALGDLTHRHPPPRATGAQPPARRLRGWVGGPVARGGGSYHDIKRRKWPRPEQLRHLRHLNGNATDSAIQHLLRRPILPVRRIQHLAAQHGARL